MQNQDFFKHLVKTQSVPSAAPAPLIKPARNDSKTLPTNLTLQDLLKPRTIATKLSEPVIPKTKQERRIEKDKEAQEYVDRLHGDREISNLIVKECIDLILGKPMGKFPKTHISRMSYRFDLGFRDNLYEGSEDGPVILIAGVQKESNRRMKQEIMDWEEREILRGLVSELGIDNTNAKTKGNVIPKITPVKEEVESDDGSDIFEDAGTDYIPELKPKSSPSQLNSPKKVALFQETLVIKEEIKLDLPMALDIDAGLSRLIQNSHRIRQPTLHQEDRDDVHELEDVQLDVLDYGALYENSDDDEEEGPAMSQTARMNQDFQRLDNLYGNKYGSGLKSDSAIEPTKGKRKGQGEGPRRKK